jgi:hypothetical protein
MASIIYCKFSENVDRGFRYGRGERATYELMWDVKVDDGSLAGPVVLEMARAAAVSASCPNPVARYNYTYTFNGFEDGGSFAREFSGRIKDVDSDGTLWQFAATYVPPEPTETTSALQDPNPLNWAPEYWIEWIEEQIPVEKAYCYTQMEQLRRGPNYLPGKSEVNEPGPIVNAAGQQTIDPIMTTIIRPIVCAVFNAPTYLDAAYLNRVFGNTVNGDHDSEVDAYKNVDKFLGDDARTWKFLMATSDRRQQHTLKYPLKENPAERNVTIFYYPTTVKLQFRKETWDSKVLNNGMVAYKYVKGFYPTSGFGGSDPYNTTALLNVGCDELNNYKGDGHIQTDDAKKIKAVFPCQVYASPTSRTRVDAAEPQLLNLDGVQQDPRWDYPPVPSYIEYRFLDEVLYGGSTGMLIPWRAGLTPDFTGVLKFYQNYNIF